MLLCQGKEAWGVVMSKGRLCRRVVYIILGVAVLIATAMVATYLCSHIDRIIWSTELTGLVGHPMADLEALAARDPKLGLHIVTDDKDVAVITRFFYPPTRLRNSGKVIVAYRHRFPGQWQALIFIGSQGTVEAVQIGSLDAYELELARRKDVRLGHKGQSPVID